MQSVRASWHATLGHHTLTYLNVSPTSFPVIRNSVLYYNSKISRPTSSENYLCVARQMDRIENRVLRFCYECKSLFPFYLVAGITVSCGLGKHNAWLISSMMRLCSVPMFCQELLRSGGSTRHLGWLQLEPTKFLFEIFEIARLYPTLALGSGTLLKADQDSASGSQQCETTEGLSNPDIVGSGVRLSTYILMLTTFASLFIGSFHSGPSGTKEPGIAILISMYTLDTRSGYMYRIDRAQVCYP
jgi:hypothetical protein